MVQQTARKTKAYIEKFCKARVNAGLCSEDECDFCSVCKTYYLVKQYVNNENDVKEAED